MTTTVSQKHRRARALGLTGALVLVGLAACDAANKTSGVATSATETPMTVGMGKLMFVTGASTDSPKTWTDSAGRVIHQSHFRLSIAAQPSAMGRTQPATADGQIAVTITPR